MKKFYIFALAVMLFAACTTDQTADVQPIDAPETLTVSFEEDTRIQLNEAQKTVWNEGDLVSVFYRSNANQKWQFQGKTGDRMGSIVCIADADATQELSDIIVVYPYNENYYINYRTCNVQAYLPATQHYLKDSYGLDGNIMISSSEYNQFSLKNVCGWLKLQLTGNGEEVKSITLKGNSGEQVAGQIYINSADATATLASEMGVADDNENGVGGNLVFDGTILTEVALDCGEGVTLGSKATAFYIALPPQTFEKGLTATIKAVGYEPMVLNTGNTVVIDRNAIQPMASVIFEAEEKLTPESNEIWYTSLDGKIEKSNWDYDTFGASIIESIYDEQSGKGVIVFDGEVTKIGEKAFEGVPTTSILIPDSVTEIGDHSFRLCYSMLSFEIPNGVTKIGISAFYNCRKITNIEIPDSIESISNYTFYGCESLTNVTIPNSVISIGELAFASCSGLTSIIIPDGVTSIGHSAFNNCYNMISVYCKPTTPPVCGNYVFAGNASGRKIYVPASDDDSIINAYRSAQYWSKYADDIEEYDFSAEQ